MCAETASVSYGTCHVTTKQRCKYTILLDIPKTCCNIYIYKEKEKELVTHSAESHATRPQWVCSRAESSATSKRSIIVTIIINIVGLSVNWIVIFFFFFCWCCCFCKLLWTAGSSSHHDIWAVHFLGRTFLVNGCFAGTSSSDQKSAEWANQSSSNNNNSNNVLF